MRPNASGTTRANTSLTIGSLNDRKIFVTRSSAGSITCGTIHKRSKAYFVLFFNSHVELLMRAYIALLGAAYSHSQETSSVTLPEIEIRTLANRILQEAGKLDCKPEDCS